MRIDLVRRLLISSLLSGTVLALSGAGAEHWLWLTTVVFVTSLLWQILLNWGLRLVAREKCVQTLVSWELVGLAICSPVVASGELLAIAGVAGFLAAATCALGAFKQWWHL